MNKAFAIHREGELRTPYFRVSFPHIFDTHKMTGKYGLGMVFDADVDFSLLEDLINKTAEDKWGQKIPKNLMWPILDGDSSGRTEYEGKIYINGKGGKYKIPIVNRDRTPLEEPEDFYAGCYARAIVTCYAWSAQGKNGVSVAVRSLQKTGEGEPFVGRVRPEDDFDELPPVSDEAEDI